MYICNVTCYHGYHSITASVGIMAINGISLLEPGGIFPAIDYSVNQAITCEENLYILYVIYIQ